MKEIVVTVYTAIFALLATVASLRFLTFTYFKTYRDAIIGISSLAGIALSVLLGFASAPWPDALWITGLALLVIEGGAWVSFLIMAERRRGH